LLSWHFPARVVNIDDNQISGSVVIQHDLLKKFSAPRVWLFRKMDMIRVGFRVEVEFLSLFLTKMPNQVLSIKLMI
jgi:hypothetical protein